MSACSTITTGTTQSIIVTSEPSGAVCQVTRDGQLIGVVNPTPGSLTLSKSSKDLVINCSRPGYQAGVNIVKADFQAATLGNILLGGVVGLAIDAASGAMGNYPPSAAVMMAPEGSIPTASPVTNAAVIQAAVPAPVAAPAAVVTSDTAKPQAVSEAASTTIPKSGEFRVEPTVAHMPATRAPKVSQRKCSAYSYQEYLQQKHVCDREDGLN